MAGAAWMDAFEYLSVLLSIILGLAITQVLQGYRGLLLSRSTVTVYAPTLIWSALLLLIVTQSWWASFGLSDHRDWDFGSFSLILLQMVLLYMMAALILPDVPRGEPVDLRAHFYRERRPFFAIFLAMLATSLIKDWVLDGDLPEAENILAHAVFGALSVLALIVRKPRFHEIAAPVTAGLAIIYIAALFARL
jgi:hypothetical protein